jgi:hypothetical protein
MSFIKASKMNLVFILKLSVSQIGADVNAEEMDSYF